MGANTVDCGKHNLIKTALALTQCSLFYSFLVGVVKHRNSPQFCYFTDSKKHFDDSGDHDDDHPPSSGSQAFQICSL